MTFRDTDFLTVERLGPMQSLTPEGFLIIRNVPLARTGPQLYSDQEIPIRGDASGRIIIDREPEEVFRPATLASLNGKAVTLDHPDEDVTPENYKGLLVGTVINPRRGLNAIDNLLLGDLVIYDPAAIKAIRDREVREVSVGYKADYEETGDARGRQRNIICNHLALVRDGRCGPVCRIGDKAFFPRHETDCGCAACTHDEFTESEHPRDDTGQFTAGSGGSGPKAEPAAKAAPPVDQTDVDFHHPEQRQLWANRISDQYGIPHQDLQLDPSLSGHALAHASGSGIKLNPEYWGNPQKMAEYEKQWGGGMMADASPKGTLLHELGHKMLQQIRPPAGMPARFYKQWYRQKDAIVDKYFNDPEMVVSAYAQEHPHEWAAEAFAAAHNGKLDWPYTQKAADGAKAMWQELYAHGDRDPNGRLKADAKPRAVG